ncbi:LysR family transcriptional regulator [Ferrimonas pelagia]|uniref:LysR family transcriptional regulator n=1 Tax=Ferrimonas pelagia TaxID=1177826 RepID=A0ABP9EXB6_9GAMM
MDRLDAIQAFVTVVDRGSFSRAADALGRSRLQVSRQVKSLEDWLQVRLLHRTTRSLSLTEEGERALRHFEPILSQQAALKLDMQDSRVILRGAIRIAAPVGLAQGLLMQAIARFNQQYPEIDFDLVLSDRYAPLAEQRLDLALRYSHQPDEHLIARRLMSIGSVLCASPDYLHRAGTPSEPLHLLGHSCLVHLERSRWTLFREQQPIPIEVRGHIKANELATLKNAALAHQGIAALPCDLANPLLDQGLLVRVLPQYQLSTQALWAVYLSRSYQQARVRAFIDFLAQHWHDDLMPADLQPIDNSDA